MRMLITGTCLFTLLVLAGCAAKGATPLGEDDTPVNNYNKGMEAVENDIWNGALVNFDRAVALLPGYAPGLAGKAFVLAEETSLARNQAEKREERAESFRRLLDKAIKHSKTEAEELNVRILAIRAETLAKGDNWYGKARSHYEAGRRLDARESDSGLYYRSRQALNYYMAQACFDEHDFDCAETLLRRVLGSPEGRWRQAADTTFSRLQLMERISINRLSSDLAWKLMARNTVSRAEAAAVLIGELGDRLPSRDFLVGDCPMPNDVKGHAYQDEIIRTLSLKLRGLDLVRSQAEGCFFKPEATLTRKELAMMLEDLLGLLTSESVSATRFLGQDKSPYKDVRSHALWYNSVLIVVNRNLMQTDLTGAFRPNDAVTGTECLMAICRLRNANQAQ